MDEFEEDQFISRTKSHWVVCWTRAGSEGRRRSRICRPCREKQVLFEYEVLALSEIAGIVGTDVGTVKSRLIPGKGGIKKYSSSYLENNQELNTSGNCYFGAGLK